MCRTRRRRLRVASAIAGYRAELRGTAEARDTARFLLLTPPLPLAARPGYAALAGAAVALLPGWARRPLRLPHLPVTERVVNLPIGDAATALIRWAMAPRPPESQATDAASRRQSRPTQRASSSAPASPDFSGWNWVADSGPFSTAAMNRSPSCSAQVTTGGRNRSSGGSSHRRAA